MQTYKSPLKERIASSASLEQSFTSTCKISCKIRFTEAHEQKFITNPKSQVIFNTYMHCNYKKTCFEISENEQYMCLESNKL